LQVTGRFSVKAPAGSVNLKPTGSPYVVTTASLDQPLPAAIDEPQEQALEMLAQVPVALTDPDEVPMFEEVPIAAALAGAAAVLAGRWQRRRPARIDPQEGPAHDTDDAAADDQARSCPETAIAGGLIELQARPRVVTLGEATRPCVGAISIDCGDVCDTDLRVPVLTDAMTGAAPNQAQAVFSMPFEVFETPDADQERDCLRGAQALGSGTLSHAVDAGPRSAQAHLVHGRADAGISVDDRAQLLLVPIASIDEAEVTPDLFGLCDRQAAGISLIGDSVLILEGQVALPGALGELAAGASRDRCPHDVGISSGSVALVDHAVLSGHLSSIGGMTATLADAGLAMLMPGALAAIEAGAHDEHEIESVDEASIESPLAPPSAVACRDDESGAPAGALVSALAAQRDVGGPSTLPQAAPPELEPDGGASERPPAGWLASAREGLAAGLSRLSGRVRVSFGRRRQSDD
jgi:hypothetical protein